MRIRIWLTIIIIVHCLSRLYHVFNGWVCKWRSPKSEWNSVKNNKILCPEWPAILKKMPRFVMVNLVNLYEIFSAYRKQNLSWRSEKTYPRSIICKGLISKWLFKTRTKGKQSFKVFTSAIFSLNEFFINFVEPSTSGFPGKTASLVGH